MSNLPCDECVQTDNHCCLADIPHTIPDAMYLKYKANQLNIECIITSHPKADKHVVLVQEHMRGKDVTKFPCIFLSAGRCLIYDDRPTICRAYGTKAMPCRYDISGHTTKFEIGKLTREEIYELDSKTNINNLFEQIINGSLK